MPVGVSSVTCTATDAVTVNYRGTLITGAEFDSSYKRGQPTTFQVGNAIRGWTGDLSWEGCSVLLPDRFPVGTLMEVTLTTPRGDVSAKATVVWVDPLERLQTRHLTRHGVRFAQVSWTREHALDLVLDRISTAVAQEPQGE